jgi:spore germination protein KC
MAAFGRIGIAAALLLLLSGCWDRTEINDLAFILSTGIDLENDGSIRYSVMLPLPGSMGGATGGGGGTGGAGKSYYLDSETGKTYREAQAKLQKRMSRRMVLAHRRTVLVGEEFARKMGVMSVFDATPRSPESRMTTYFIVAEGKAYDLLRATPQFERFPSEAIRELAKSKMVIDMNLKDFALALTLPGGDPVAIHMGVRETQRSPKPSREVQILGYGQFKRDKLVGILEGRAAAGLTWLKAGSINIAATLQMNEQIINVRVFDTASQIIAHVGDNELSFDIEVTTKAKIVESSHDYDFSQPGNMAKVEAALSAYIKQSIEETLRRMADKETDSAQLGNYVWQAYPKIWAERYAKMWPKPLKSAKFQIRVNSILTESGLIYDNIIKSESSP